MAKFDDKVLYMTEDEQRRYFRDYISYRVTLETGLQPHEFSRSIKDLIWFFVENQILQIQQTEQLIKRIQCETDSEDPNKININVKIPRKE